MNRLSIVIPSYNSGRTIEHTLAAIKSQNERNAICEVIVVDSSDDGATKKELSRHLSDGVRTITPGVRVLPALGRNIGARQAKGDILVFMDADTFPAPDWTEKVLESLQEGRLAGGGSISLPDFQKNRLIPAAQYYLQLNEFMDWGDARVKNFLPSCNLFCGRELFEKVGGFPLLRAAEDVVFGLKVSKFADLWFIPEVKVSHIFREDLKGFLENEVILGNGNLQYRRLQYPKTFYYRGFWPLLFLPGFIAIKLGRITFRILRSGSGSFFHFLATLPVFFLGLLFWSIGFAQGAIQDANH
jgi:glycosyltransferase involved in cell wall biosynthesis